MSVSQLISKSADLNIQKYMEQLVMPEQDSHKGENGKVLVIGGSTLFHAASFWAASTASRFVDMVHFSSPALENNELMRVRAKSGFWEGIVTPWEEVSHYIEEDDVILIGPGMMRSEPTNSNQQTVISKQQAVISNKHIGETREIVNYLLKRYPDKRWVVDGGALQEVEPRLLNEHHLITPNKRELGILCERAKIEYRIENVGETVRLLSDKLGCVVLAKGQVDVISNGEETIEVPGGNAGMTKGGTGDVLAGLVAALYAKSPGLSACVVASYCNKQAGERLYERVGVYYSAIDLACEVPLVLGELTKS